ncbi:sensor histidine kinase [Xanthomonas sp. WHRI 7945]|nr:ATP-binding protein [Xanthomonas campestris pv. campestris]
MRLHSLSARLLAAAVAGLIAATAVGAAVLGLQMWPDDPTRILRAELAEEVQHIAEGMGVDGAGQVTVRLSDSNAAIYDAMPRDAAYEVQDARGRPLAHSPNGPALRALRAMAPDAKVLHVDVRGRSLALEVAQVGIAHAGVPFTVRVARSHRLVTTLQHHAGELYLRALLLTTAVALLIFVAVVYLTVTRMLRPIRAVSDAAAAIGPRNLAARLRGDSLPAELRPLIAAFNTTLDRLQAGFQVQQQFLAAAAHELKTPLALLQGEIELGGAANRELLLRDTALMARQVHQLLQLAEVSEGHNFRFSSIAPDAVLEDAVRYLQRLGQQHAVSVVFRQGMATSANVEADSAALFVLAKNLLENAILHSPRGGVVVLALHANGFSVQDQGSGVALGDRPHLFARFWRARTDEREGAGLGLSICAEICGAHGWRVALADAGDAGGARFEVVFDATAELRP